MSLHLRYTTHATLGLALVGLAAYAVVKSGILRPAVVGVIRGGVKAADWLGDTMACAKQNVSEMVAEAKAPKAKPAVKPAAKATAKPAAKTSAKPAAAKNLAAKPVAKAPAAEATKV